MNKKVPGVESGPSHVATQGHRGRGEAIPAPREACRAECQDEEQPVHRLSWLHATTAPGEARPEGGAPSLGKTGAPPCASAFLPEIQDPGSQDLSFGFSLVEMGKRRLREKQLVELGLGLPLSDRLIFSASGSVEMVL